MKCMPALTVLAVAAFIGCGSTPAAAASSDVRLSCAADGARDVSISARFEDRRGRRKFDASFEAAQGLGFIVGQRLAVVVGCVAVGQMTLARDPLNGDVSGDLEFDSRRDENNPFPVNFPTVARGISVVVGPLGCSLN
ncbi:MAG: hypothetical protein K2Q06_13565 [Parvularculaceae bacterium]|nr:hypothetical protein [Parvularculaceae bacterium]